MAAHDVLYKYVEELTGEPVDPSQYRPTFTGAMAALDAALTGEAVTRKNTISEAIEEHLPTHEGGGGGAVKRVALELTHSQYDTPMLFRLKITIANNGDETVLTGEDLTPAPISDNYLFEAPCGSTIHITDTSYPHASYSITEFGWYIPGPEFAQKVVYYKVPETTPITPLPSVILSNDPEIINFYMVANFWQVNS